MKLQSVITISADVGLLIKKAAPESEESMLEEDECDGTSPEEHEWCQFDSINTSTMTCFCNHTNLQDLLLFDRTSPNSSILDDVCCHEDVLDGRCNTPLKNMYGSDASFLSAQETPRSNLDVRQDNDRTYQHAEYSLEKLEYSRMQRLQLYSSIESKISQMELSRQAEKDRQRLDLERKICNQSSMQQYYLNSIEQGVDDVMSSQSERMDVYERIRRRIDDLQRNLHRRDFPPLERKKKYRRFTTFTRLIQGEHSSLAHEEQQISILDEEDEEFAYCLQGYA
mmetsp:Transcript_1233/g.2663  ORF Transcript_1233/g.2663 Transcript_1233/m.2663 type:complete len:282 (-) Transcript_1233:57-902(-)|eukprot:762653-Hanusia_phi.AAC.2